MWRCSGLCVRDSRFDVAPPVRPCVYQEWRWVGGVYELDGPLVVTARVGMAH